MKGRTSASLITAMESAPFCFINEDLAGRLTCSPCFLRHGLHRAPSAGREGVCRRAPLTIPIDSRQLLIHFDILCSNPTKEPCSDSAEPPRVQLPRLRFSSPHDAG